MRLSAIGSQFGSALFALVFASVCAFSAAPEDRIIAGVELGSKGAKFLVLQIPANGPAQRVFAKTLDPGPLTDAAPDGTISANGMTRVADAVAELSKIARDRFKVPPSKLVVLGSSGLASAPNHAALAEKVRTRTGCVVKFITTDEEAALVFRGLVAPADRLTTMAMDIGSGNARVCGEGWFSGIGWWRVSGTVPFGSVTAASADPAKVARLIHSMAKRHPTLTHDRMRCHLTGGAAWALVTLLKPEAADKTTVRITSTDIADFAQIIKEAEGRFPDIKLDHIQNPTVKAAALADLKRVRDTFNPEQLRAAALLLSQFANAYRFSAKDVTFRRDGQFAWLLAYLHEAPQTDVRSYFIPCPSQTNP